MAYVREWKEKEECWGAPCYRVERELMADEEEIADLLVDKVLDVGIDDVVCYSRSYTSKELYITAPLSTIDDYTEEDIEIDAAEFVDVQHMYSVLTNMDEEDYNKWESQPDETKRIDLYAMLGVLTPESRRLSRKEKCGS